MGEIAWTLLKKFWPEFLALIAVGILIVLFTHMLKVHDERIAASAVNAEIERIRKEQDETQTKQKAIRAAPPSVHEFHDKLRKHKWNTPVVLS